MTKPERDIFHLRRIELYARSRGLWHLAARVQKAWKALSSGPVIGGHLKL
jgi:hypothetical protein